MEKLKTSVLLIIFLFLSSLSKNSVGDDLINEGFNGAVKNDLAKENLMGMVRSLTENRYSPIEGGDTIRKGGWQTKNRYIYNKKGNRIEFDRFWSTGQPYKQSVYLHDDKDNKIEEDTYGSSSKMEEVPFQKLFYKHDEQNNIVEMNRYSFEGVFYDKEVFSYDKKGGRIELKHYRYKQDSLIQKLSYKHDDKGNITEVCYYATNDSVIAKQTLQRDEQGRKILQYAVDKKGEKTTDMWKYDDKNNDVEWKRYNADGSLYMRQNYSYTFDNIGNWIKKTAFRNDTIYTIYQREIEYY